MTQQLKHVIGAIDAVDGQSPQHRATNEDGPRSQRQGLQHIGAAPDATIKIDLAASLRCCHHFGQGIYGSLHTIKLPTSVIGNYDAIYAMLNSQSRILCCDNTLEQKR